MSFLENYTKNLMRFEKYGNDSTDFDKPTGESYTAMINPDTFERSFSYHYGDNDTIGQPGTTGKLIQTDPESYSFTLIIDGTGIVTKVPKDVTKELEKLMKVLFKEDKKTPDHVRLYYCNDYFDCTVTTFNISYTLFDKAGKPLRAKVTCGFASKHLITEDKEEKKQEEEESPFKNIKLIIDIATKKDWESLIRTLLNEK